MPDYPLVFIEFHSLSYSKRSAFASLALIQTDFILNSWLAFFVARTRYFPYLSGCYYEPVVAVISALGFICLGKIDIFHKKTDDISSMYGGIF